VSENQKRNKPSDSLLNRLSAYQYTKWLSMNLVNEEKSSIKKYVFFISHSTKDTGLYVQDLCEIFETLRVQNFFADRDAPLGSFLPDQVKNAIDNSELFLVIFTQNSRTSPWVNQEIGYALGKGVPVIPLRKGNIRIKGLIETARYVELKQNPMETVQEVFSKLSAMSLSSSAQAIIITVVASLKLNEKFGKKYEAKK
jgi:hypothetical protein